MPKKDSSAAIIQALQKELADLRAELRATLPQDAPAAVQPPAYVPKPCNGSGGPPSAFMALVRAKRGERVEPLADDPEAAALDQAAEKLAAMHPIDRQAYLEGLRQKGRRDDLRKERAELDLPALSDEELDELLGNGE